MRRNHLATGCAALACLSLAESQVTFAGWSGQMNGTGFGRATANVTSVAGVGAAATITTQGPSAGINPTPGYTASALLPAGSSASTTSLIKGSAGYIWQATTFATGGDKTDNATIEGLTDVTPAPFASLFLSTSVTTDNNNTRTLHFDGIATDGTAIFLQVFQDAGFQTTDLQSGKDESGGFSAQNIFYSNLYVGDGELGPPGGAIPPGTQFHFTFELPKDVPDSQLIVSIDGFAASVAPDSGSIGLAFALTVAGLIFTRRLIAPATGC